MPDKSFQIIDTPTGPICLGGKIHEALAAITAEIDPVGKSGTNQFQKYKYRPVDEFMNVTNKAMTKHQVSCRPVKVETLNDELVSTGPDKVKHRVSVLVTYLFSHADGSFAFAQCRGFGEDTSDKASNKALAASFKYLIMQSFMVPTREISDGDEETPPPANQTVDVKTSESIAEYGDWIDQVVLGNADKAKGLTEVLVAVMKDSKPIQTAVKPLLKAAADKLKLGYNAKLKSYVPKS